MKSNLLTFLPIKLYGLSIHLGSSPTQLFNTFYNSCIFVFNFKTFDLFGPCLGIRCTVGIQMATHLSQYYLLRNPTFLFDLEYHFYNIKVPYAFVSVYGLCVFSFNDYLFMCQYHTVLITVALLYNPFYFSSANSLSCLPEYFHSASLLSSSPIFYSQQTTIPPT